MAFTKSQKRKWAALIAKRNREIVSKIKLERGCVDCGYKAHAAALQFDHVRGVKKYLVSRMHTHPVDMVLGEIAKCEVRCANCHAIRHAQAYHPADPVL